LNNQLVAGLASQRTAKQGSALRKNKKGNRQALASTVPFFVKRLKAA
jgi:hypothetical protein